MEAHSLGHRFTVRILLGMFFGVLVGLAGKYLPVPSTVVQLIVVNFLGSLGQIFILLIRMVVVPVVFVSLVCGAADLKAFRSLGRLGGKSLLLYVLTTAIAVSLALLLAHCVGVGVGKQPIHQTLRLAQGPAISQTLINMFTSNPFHSLAEGNMLQIVVFSLLLGLAIASAGQMGEKVAAGFHAMNAVIIRLVMMVIQLAPVGVFCLLSKQFYVMGLAGVWQVARYFVVVVAVLFIQYSVTYSVLLQLIARMNPLAFFKKIYPATLFAFCVSSSSACIPVTLNTVKRKLGVSNRVASFVVPVGATINMDGTAIMQGVATVFIANVYGVSLGLSGYLTVVLMSTLSSIGTAGVPGVGLMTLAMVLQQVGLPVEGIALIIGVDRLLDMLRTAVNVTGDAMIACCLQRSEGEPEQEELNEYA